ncbi:MAG: hypothetical protein FWE37_08990 [Spirochaetaceae bacterium]|nr:hypothetical protein [Spirochaetaceae bacterium]
MKTLSKFLLLIVLAALVACGDGRSAVSGVLGGGVPPTGPGGGGPGGPGGNALEPDADGLIRVVTLPIRFRINNVATATAWGLHNFANPDPSASAFTANNAADALLTNATMAQLTVNARRVGFDSVWPADAAQEIVVRISISEFDRLLAITSGTAGHLETMGENRANIFFVFPGLVPNPTFPNAPSGVVTNTIGTFTDVRVFWMAGRAGGGSDSAPNTTPNTPFNIAAIGGGTVRYVQNNRAFTFVEGQSYNNNAERQRQIGFLLVGPPSAFNNYIVAQSVDGSGIPILP